MDKEGKPNAREPLGYRVIFDRKPSKKIAFAHSPPILISGIYLLSLTFIISIFLRSSVNYFELPSSNSNRALDSYGLLLS